MGSPRVKDPRGRGGASRGETGRVRQAARLGAVVNDLRRDARTEACDSWDARRNCPLRRLSPPLILQGQLRTAADGGRAADVEALLDAAPHLEMLQAADVKASLDVAVRLLRHNAPVAAVVQLSKLCVSFSRLAQDHTGVAETLQLAAAMSQQQSLNELVAFALPLQFSVASDALLAAAVACQLRSLMFRDCCLSSDSVPGLARAVRDLHHLEELIIINNETALFVDAPAAAGELAAAIHGSHRLTHLALNGVALWNDADAAAVILRALIGHASVECIDLGLNDALDDEAAAAAGALLYALVAADAASLTYLNVHFSYLTDDGLAPLFAALPQNSHLLYMSCCNTGMSEEFARDALLPAVRANTSLRELEVARSWGDDEDGVPPPEVLEAEALVAARGQ